MSEPGDCRHCKSWQGCSAPPDWFHYGEIRWCPHQVFWLLRHADILRAGIWPSQSEESGGKRQFKAEGYFVKAVTIIAELDYRLGKTGIKGELLASQCKEQDREKMDYLSDNAKDALYYVAGLGRKSISFPKWLADRRYHRKSDKNVVISRE